MNAFCMYWCDLPASAPAVPWSSMLRCFSFSSITPHFGPRVNIYARSASESFARLFKGGGVQGRSPCPRSAERGTLLCLFKRRRGSKGEPSPGVPPSCFSPSACAPLRWEVFVGLPCDSTPFLLSCQKKRCRAAKEKRLFYPGGSTIRVSAAASVVFTHLRPTWGRGLVG